MTTKLQDHTDDMSGLHALGTMTAEIDEANPDPQQAQAKAEEAKAMSEADAQAQSWGMVMFTVGGMATMIAPELRQIYTQERCFEWGQSAYAVAEKHGLKGPGNMPEITLLASTMSFAIPTFFAVREKLKEAQEGKGPVTWLNKLGLWWRTRKARAQAAKMKAGQIDQTETGAPGASHGA